MKKPKILTPGEADKLFRELEGVLFYVPTTMPISYQKAKDSLPDLMFSYRAMSPPYPWIRMGANNECLEKVIEIIENRKKKNPILESVYDDLIEEVSKLEIR